jgi:hypothetical protein
MHSFGREPLGFANITKFDVRPGDWICFSFGEIDCKCHVNRYITSDTTFEQVIQKLVDTYMAGIALNTAQVPGVHVAVFMIPPEVPLVQEPHFAGTPEERAANTRYMNQLLKCACASHGYVFIDAYDHYVTEDGFMNMSLSDNICHLKYSPPVEAILDRLLSKVPSTESA